MPLQPSEKFLTPGQFLFSGVFYRVRLVSRQPSLRTRLPFRNCSCKFGPENQLPNRICSDRSRLCSDGIHLFWRSTAERHELQAACRRASPPFCRGICRRAAAYSQFFLICRYRVQPFWPPYLHRRSFWAARSRPQDRSRLRSHAGRSSLPSKPSGRQRR